MFKTGYNIVGLKELRENTEEYIRAVSRGYRFIVARKSKPLFRIDSWQEVDELWDPVIDFNQIKKGGVKLEEILKRL